MNIVIPVELSYKFCSSLMIRLYYLNVVSVCFSNYFLMFTDKKCQNKYLGTVAILKSNKIYVQKLRLTSDVSETVVPHQTVVPHLKKIHIHNSSNKYGCQTNSKIILNI